MREMHWSWEQFEQTPVGVRQYTWAFLMAERRQRARQARQKPDEPGVVRIRR